MEKAFNVDTIYQCNLLLGEKTLHPLVSIVDLSEKNNVLHESLRANFYCIILKQYKGEHHCYGRKDCDYSDGTVVFTAPGKLFSIKNSNLQFDNQGYMLAFHPELISNINDYKFFCYDEKESLHLSQREKKTFLRCIEYIKEELNHAIDKYSFSLVAKSIEILLDYCLRFYERQFITRSEENIGLIRKMERCIDKYYGDSEIKTKELPAKYYSEQLHLSPAYFTELLKYETGYTMSEYIQVKQIEIAKKWLSKTTKTVAEIVYALGFSSPEYFCKLFKKITGLTPSQYKLRN